MIPIKKDNPAFNYSLVDSPGQDPTDLQVEAARKLVMKLESSRETYVNKDQYLTPEGKIYTSSDSARYIARNETYNRLFRILNRKTVSLIPISIPISASPLRKKALIPVPLTV